MLIFTVIGLASTAFLPSSLSLVPPWLVPTLSVLVLIPLVVLNPHRLDREYTWSRLIGIGFAVALTAVNQVYVVLIIVTLVTGSANGSSVLLSALQVWVTNVVTFSLIYWEIDKGGPVARRVEGTNDDAQQDFRFPQQDNPDGATGWMPEFVDYAYFSLTNMMAFSPTDVMPLSSRAKGLMAYQALTAFVLLALVISRAVNILN